VLAPDREAAPADPLRPDWLPQLTGALGEHATATLLVDPRWPAVIAAVTRTTEHGVPLGDLLRVPVGPDGEPLPGHALADALIYRALTMADPVPDYPADTYDLDDTRSAGDAHGSYVEPEDPDLIPPQDLHMVTTFDPHAPDNLAETPLDFTHAATAAVRRPGTRRAAGLRRRRAAAGWGRRRRPGRGRRGSQRGWASAGRSVG